MPLRMITIQQLMTIRYLVFLASFAIIALNCSWGDSSPAPVVTVVPPTIISTYPPDKGTGPFNLYTPRPDTVKPHFTVHFSKTMNLSTLNAATVTCTGFNEAVKVQVLSSTLTNGDIIAFQVVSSNSGPSNGKPLMYGINTTYTVAIDPSVQDNNGNALGTGYTFSFTPEPYFRVVGYTYNDGDTIIPASVGIYFNSKLSAQINNAITIFPSISNPLLIDSTTDSTSVYMDTYLATTPGVSYSISVSAGAHDAFGNLIHSGIQKSFYVPPITVSRNIYSLQSVNLASQIVLSFNYPMTISSIDSAFSFSPPTSLITSVGGSQLSLYAVNDFVPNTDYTIQLTTVLTTTNGFHIQSPVIIPFHTAGFAVTHIPTAGETNVSTHDVIELDFTGAVDTATIRNNVSVSPDVSHIWTFASGTAPGKFIYAYYTPTMAIFASRQQYKVIISDSIQSIAGYHLAVPDTFSFTTGN